MTNINREVNVDDSLKGNINGQEQDLNEFIEQLTKIRDEYKGTGSIKLKVDSSPVFDGSGAVSGSRCELKFWDSATHDLPEGCKERERFELEMFCEVNKDGNEVVAKVYWDNGLLDYIIKFYINGRHSKIDDRDSQRRDFAVLIAREHAEYLLKAQSKSDRCESTRALLN